MDDPNLDGDPDHAAEPGDDVREQQVAERLLQLFEEHPTTVFYGRQLEVMFEKDFFHWITNRALRSLEGHLVLEQHPFHIPARPPWRGTANIAIPAAKSPT